MTTKGEAFAGLSVAITTPFRDAAVDYEALRAQVEFQVAAGTTCLCPVGTTGECPTLDHEEHERVIAAVCERAAGRIKVMPGTGSNSTREAIRLTKFAKRVIVVHRRDSFRAEKILQERLFKNPRIEVIWDTAIDEIVGAKDPKSVTGLRLKNVKTGKISAQTAATLTNAATAIIALL